MRYPMMQLYPENQHSYRQQGEKHEFRRLKTNNDHTTIWLNGESCVSIIFHEFSAWAKFDDSNYQGQKYEVTKIVKGDTENRSDKRDERKRKYEERLQENPDNIASFFHPDDDGDY